MQMPGMDGLELARAITADPALAGMPLVMLSSSGQTGLAAAAREAGIADLPHQAGAPTRLLRRAGRRCSGTPDVAAPPRPRATPAAARRPRAAPPLRILVAEDNTVNQQVATRMLEKRGHRVDVVANGREAVAALDGARLRSGLHGLPDARDGWASRRRARSARGSRDGRHIPIIALTANAMQGDRERCLAAGMDDYIAKPLTKGTLIETVERWGALSADAPNAV